MFKLGFEKVAVVFSKQIKKLKLPKGETAYLRGEVARDLGMLRRFNGNKRTKPKFKLDALFIKNKRFHTLETTKPIPSRGTYKGDFKVTKHKGGVK